MKTQFKFTVAVLATFLLFPALSVGAAEVTKSMRGIDVATPDQAATVKIFPNSRPGTTKPLDRTFSTQPPVIPHAVENFNEINLEENQCLDCHGAANYKKKNAPKIGESHFFTRDGKQLSEESARRYNCVQCHVPQADAPPLVENNFKGDLKTKEKTADAMKKSAIKN